MYNAIYTGIKTFTINFLIGLTVTYVGFNLALGIQNFDEFFRTLLIISASATSLWSLNFLKTWVSQNKEVFTSKQRKPMATRTVQAAF